MGVTPSVREYESHFFSAWVLRKVNGRKLVEYGSHLYILVLNDMLVEGPLHRL